MQYVRLGMGVLEFGGGRGKKRSNSQQKEEDTKEERWGKAGVVHSYKVYLGCRG